MFRIFALLCLAGVLITALIPAQNLLARPVLEDAAIEGVVTFDKRFVAVQPIIPGQLMRVVMRFDPQDQQELARRSGFFLLDGDRLRSFNAGGSLLDNNLASGSQDPNRPANELVATIERPSGEYAVVIYNDTDIPMTFHLWVENGTFPQEEIATAPSVDPAPAAPPTKTQAAEIPPAAAVSQPSAVASNTSRTDSRTDNSTGPTYTVRSGDTLGLIAQTIYGDLSLYARLCSYNSIGNCDVIEVGQALRTPSLAELTDSPSPAVTPAEAIPAVAVTGAQQSNTSAAASSTSDRYTVVAGDTLGTIAQRLYGDFQRYSEICALNGLADCGTVTIGQVLRLPGGSGAQTQTAIKSTETTTAPETPAPEAPAPSPPTTAPSAPQTSALGLVPTLEQSDHMSIFVMLWKTTGLLSFLETDGPLTLFVPSDTIFAPVTQANLTNWMTNKQVLERLLSYHVVVRSIDPGSVGTDGIDLGTLEGTPIRLERGADGALTVNGARVIGTPIVASNGTIYTIDQVLAPPQ